MKKYVSENWSFNPVTRLLTRAESESIKLPHKAAQLLELLCENQGELLPSYQIIEEIWDGNLTVGEQGLRQIIWRLRKEIPDGDLEEPAVINIPRKGYQLRDQISASEISLPKRVRSKYMVAAWFGIAVIFLALLATYISNITAYISRTKGSDSNLEVKLVTTHTGHEESAAVSPDNRQLIYTSNEAGDFDIYLRDLQQPADEDTLLLEQPLNQGAMTWSPDGSKFAYLSTTENKDVDDVYIYDLTSRSKTQVAKQYVPTFSKAPYGLAWSPVDDVIAYTSITEGQTKSAIFLYDYETQESRQLLDPEYIDFHPAWSPDGKTLSFHRLINPELVGLFSVDINSGEVTDITQENVKVYGHVWLDNQYILYSGYDNGFFYPYVVDTASLEKAKLHIPGNFKFPSTSAEDIYYVRSSLERQIQLHRHSTNGLILEAIIDSAGSQTAPIVHSPSGRLIFTSNRTGSRELWYQADPDSEVKQITQENSVADFPSFSSSGRYVSYRRLNNESQELELAVYDLDQDMPVDIPVIHSFISMFAGSDRYLVYLLINDEERELWVYDLQDQSNTKLTNGVWAPIGANLPNNEIYFFKGGKVHSYNFDSKQGKELSHQPRIRPPFTIDAGKLYYFQTRETDAELFEYDLVSGEERPLFTLSTALFSKLSEFAYNPLTGQIYLNTISKNESDIYKLSRAQLRSEIERLFH